MGPARELSIIELKALFHSASESRHCERNIGLISICAYSALRIGEAVGLTNNDVIGASGKIKTQFCLSKHKTKSKKSRVVYLHEETLKHLSKYLETKKNLESELPFFESQKDIHKPIQSRAGQLIIKDLMKRAGIEGASSHSLRRMAANNLRRQGVDLETIRVLLGHSDLSVTSAYMAALPVEIEQAVNLLKY